MKTILKLLLFSIPLYLVSSQAVLAGNQEAGKYIILSTQKETSFEAYIAGPKKTTRSILVIPGWWGLNPDVRKQVDEFARDGYQAMAVDLYDGKVANEPQYARQLMHAVKQNEANARYRAALAFLHKGNKKVAIVGASFGGSQALHATLAAPSMVSATVMYYPFGKMITEKDQLAHIRKPLMGHFSRYDFAFTAEDFRKFNRAAQSASVKFQPFIYETKHGFANPANKNFDKKSYQLSRQRTMDFLAKNLQ